MGRKTRTPHFVGPTCLSVYRPFHCNDPIELKPRKHRDATRGHGFTDQNVLHIESRVRNEKRLDNVKVNDRMDRVLDQLVPRLLVQLIITRRNWRRRLRRRNFLELSSRPPSYLVK